MSRARSTIRTGSPMSSVRISPPLPCSPACSSNCVASESDMKKRVMSGCVTVTGPPRAICSAKRGITLPALPKRIDERRLDLVQRSLRDVEQHESRRAKARDLPAQLCADRSTGPGHHDDSVAEPFRDARVVEHDRIAAEQIVELDVAQHRQR